MGIFSLFGKKDAQQKKTADKDATRTKRSSTSARAEKPGAERPTSSRRDAHQAQATVLKINAIESEMSSEFVSATTTRPGPTPTRSKPSSNSGKPATPAPPKSGNEKPAAGSPTLQPLAPDMGSTTDFLLHGNSTVNDVATPFSEAAAVIEESAIMYANGQSELVEQMLRNAIGEDLLGDVTHNAWWMLFDLYQLNGKREEFEQLGLEYANKFETSPPGWCSPGKIEPAPAAAGSPPLVSFSGKLNANAARLIERIRKLAETHTTLRLEFARVSEVDREGCRQLLAVLQQLQKSGHNLVLAGARELADKIRTIITTGRRDDGEECWLLLLEILRLLNCEKEFEEASIDYCVTFEVSPPAFVAPQASVTTVALEQAPIQGVAEGFMMPPLVDGRIDNLILAIVAYSDEHEPAIIDCSQLIRIDFNAAGRLLTGLAPFCGNGKSLEFHHVNHLVAELFNIIGLKDIVRIIPRKS